MTMYGVSPSADCPSLSRLACRPLEQRRSDSPETLRSRKISRERSISTPSVLYNTANTGRDRSSSEESRLSRSQSPHTRITGSTTPTCVILDGQRYSPKLSLWVWRWGNYQCTYVCILTTVYTTCVCTCTLYIVQYFQKLS